MTPIAVVLLLVAAAAGMALLVAQVPAVWRGADVDLWSGRLPEVNRRSYLIFVVEACLVSAGLVLGFVGQITGSELLRRTVSLAGVLLALSLFPVHLAVNAFNRPGFLVPPDLRHEPGWVGRWQEARRRRAAGRPPTSHPVQILDVRPPPEEPAAYPPPCFVATCTSDECDWESEEVAQDTPQAETIVRRYAAGHSDNVLPGTERLLG